MTLTNMEKIVLYSTLKKFNLGEYFIDLLSNKIFFNKSQEIELTHVDSYNKLHKFTILNSKDREVIEKHRREFEGFNVVTITDYDSMNIETIVLENGKCYFKDYILKMYNLLK